MRNFFHPENWPLAIKLLIAFLAVAVTPVVVVGLLSQAQAREGLLTEARRNLENTSARTSTLIDEFIRNRIIDIEQTTTLDPVVRFVDRTTNDRSSLGPNNPDQLATYNVLKSKTAALTSNLTYMVIANKSGAVELTSNTNIDQEGLPLEGEPRDLSGEIYFQQALKGTTYLTPPKVINFQNRAVQSVMYIASPIRDARGIPAAVLVQRFNIHPIWQIVNADVEAAGKGSYTMLVDDSDKLGVRIADSRTSNRSEFETKYLFSVVRRIPPDQTELWTKSGRYPADFDLNLVNTNNNLLANLSNVLDKPEADKRQRFFSTSFLEGDLAIKAQAAYSPIPSRPGWYYFVVTPESAYAAAANNITTVTLLAILVATALVLLLAIVASRALTTPIRRIMRILKRIDEGDYAARVPVRSTDELGRLSASLNAVFDNTLSLIQSREEKERLQGQIMQLLEDISAVAEGDLTAQAEVNADITGAIADSFNLMIEELRKIILNIQDSTSQASTFFDQMVVNFNQLDKVSERQATRVLTVSRSVENMNQSIQQVSEAAVVSAEVAQDARENARQGGRAVSQTIAGMNRIRSNVQDTSKKIKRLGESSVQIGEIVKLIDGIADQTNMLALNAAIQAAMAGEQGKGFSVVAEEVRRLAERSARATREIAALVKSIQDDTAEAVIAMEESTLEVVDGSKVADEAGRALTAIEAVVDRLATLITNISVVSRQQAGSSAEIAASMNDLATLTQEATALRIQSTEAVETVARTAEELRVSVSAFKVHADSAAEDQVAPELQPAPVGAVSSLTEGRPEPYQFTPPTGPAGPEPLESGYYGNGNGNGHSYLNGQVNGNGAHKPSVFSSQGGEALDLNSILADETIFEAVFESGQPSAPGKEALTRRPPAIN